MIEIDCDGPSTSDAEPVAISLLMEKKADKMCRHTYFEWLPFLKAVFESLHSHESLASNEEILVIPAGSVPKGTATVDSDWDAFIVIPSCFEVDAYVKCSPTWGLKTCADLLKRKVAVTLGPYSFQYKNHYFNKKKKMEVCELLVKYKNGENTFSCNVDVSACQVGNIRSVLWVRSYSMTDPCIQDAFVEIKRLAFSLQLNITSSGTLCNWGWELLILIALVMLGIIPVIDPLFRISKQYLSVVSCTSRKDFDSDAHHVLLSLSTRDLKVFSNLKVFTVLQILRQIDDMLAPKPFVEQTVIRLRDCGFIPCVPHCLVIVDPCEQFSPGNNAASAVSPEGLFKIRNGVKTLIASLGKCKRCKYT